MQYLIIIKINFIVVLWNFYNKTNFWNESKRNFSFDDLVWHVIFETIFQPIRFNHTWYNIFKINSISLLIHYLKIF